MRVGSGEEGGPGRAADGGLAVGIGEEGAAGGERGERVDVRSDGLRMRVGEAADPVVEVIDENEEDVRVFVGFGGLRRD